MKSTREDGKANGTLGTLTHYFLWSFKSQLLKSSFLSAILTSSHQIPLLASHFPPSLFQSSCPYLQDP